MILKWKIYAALSKYNKLNHDVSIEGQRDNMSVLIGEDKNGNRFYNLNDKTYKAENSSRGNHAIGEANEEFHINIISNSNPDFNPNATINKEVNSYEEILKCINKSDKGGQMDEKLKELCAGVVNAFMKAKNEADAEKEKTDEEKRKEEEERKKEEEAKNKAKN